MSTTFFHKPGLPIINQSTLNQVGISSGGRVKPQTTSNAKVIFSGSTSSGHNKDGHLYWVASSIGALSLFGTADYVYSGGGKYNWSGELISVIVLGVTANGVAVDSSGNIYIAHLIKDSEVVSKYNSAGVKQWGVDTGNGAYGIALSYDELHVGVVGGNQAWSLNANTGAEEWEYNATQVVSHNIYGVCFDAFGNMYIGTHQTRTFIQVRKLDTGGNNVWGSGEVSSGDAQGYNIYSLVIDHATGYLYGAWEDTLATRLARVFKIDITDGTVIWKVASSGTNNMKGRQVAIDSDDNLFAARGGGSEIDKTDGSAIWEIDSVDRSVVACEGKTAVPNWDDLTVYIVGDIVIYDGTIYECIQNHIAGDDDEKPGVGVNWENYWVVA